MKKILITIISMMMLIVIISALVININKDIKLTPEQKTKLEELSLDTYNVTDFEIGTEQFGRCLNQKKYWGEQRSENVINACQTFKTHYQNCSEYNMTGNTIGECITWEKLYYTEEEMIDILDNWEEARIKLIANTKINRDAKPNKTITREGVTTIIK